MSFTSFKIYLTHFPMFSELWISESLNLPYKVLKNCSSVCLKYRVWCIGDWSKVWEIYGLYVWGWVAEADYGRDLNGDVTLNCFILLSSCLKAHNSDSFSLFHCLTSLSFHFNAYFSHSLLDWSSSSSLPAYLSLVSSFLSLSIKSGISFLISFSRVSLAMTAA